MRLWRRSRGGRLCRCRSKQTWWWLAWKAILIYHSWILCPIKAAVLQIEISFISLLSFHLFIVLLSFCYLVILLSCYLLDQPHILKAAILRVEISFIRSCSDLPHDNVTVQFHSHPSSLRICWGSVLSRILDDWTWVGALRHMKIAGLRLVGELSWPGTLHQNVRNWWSSLVLINFRKVIPTSWASISSLFSSSVFIVMNLRSIRLST